VDDSYFHLVAAVDFAVKYDDGRNPRGLLQADVVLIGVSRTSKTPLSMYLAHRKIKAANLPLIPESAPPQELYQLPPSKVIGLTINPELLREIRLERLKVLGLTNGSNYATRERIAEELDYAERVFSRIGCRTFDVTNKAVEEVASKILQVIKESEKDERG